MSLVAALAGDAEIAAQFAEGAEIAAILFFEAELAKAQGALGIIDPEAARQIAAAAQAFEPDMDVVRHGMARDGVAVPALVKALRVAIGEPHGQMLHHCATSQDAIDTGLMLRMKRVLQVLENRLSTLLHDLAQLSEEQGSTRLMAHTRMQAALPFSAADKLASWCGPLQSHCSRLHELAQSLPVQLGGPIGTGSSFGPRYRELRAALAARLDLRDSAPWHSDRTPILDIAQSFALLGGTLGKIGLDIALMAQADTVRLAGGGTSSAMAHKQNPVGAELLIALGRLNAGLLGTLAQSMLHENERSGAAWTLEWLVLPQMAEASGAALLQGSTLLHGLRFQAAR
jgi:3-carboxy-cis,cis-muconate cycloisomerase